MDDLEKGKQCFIYGLGSEMDNTYILRNVPIHSFSFCFCFLLLILSTTQRVGGKSFEVSDVHKCEVP